MIEFTADTIACLMQQHRNELLRFLVRRVSCPEAAQDIFQETFLRFTSYCEKNTIENPRAFIFRIASNLTTDYLRSRARHAYTQTETDDILLDIADPALSVEEAVISQQEFELLLQALEDLPPKCQAVFIMLRFKHYSYAQVEQALGISSTMVLKYLNRALTHCRQKLEAG